MSGKPRPIHELEAEFTARFLARVRKGPDCWEWLGYVAPNGYGQTTAPRRRTVWAHRVSYEHFVGRIPDGLVIDHLCRNRACVNPAHMEPVTSVENTLRGIGPTALNARKDACGEGHRYTSESSYRRTGDGARVCRICRRQRVRRWRARLRAA